MLTLGEAIVTNAREMVGRCSGVGRDAFMVVGGMVVGGGISARDGVEARTVSMSHFWLSYSVNMHNSLL